MSPPHLSKLLITGASGTLGYNIVHLLAKAHPEAQLYLLMRTPNPALFSEHTNVHIRQIDMFDTAGLYQSVSDIRPKAIVHCAASGVRPSKIGWFELIDLNVESTLQLFRASCEVEHCHFVHISTGLVYREQDRLRHEDDPIDTLHPYGASKAAADCLLRAGAERLNRHLTVVRPFSFTGLHDGGDRLFPSLLRAAANHTPFNMSSGEQCRDFCAVQDVADAVRIILENGNTSARNVFNIGSGNSISLRSIVEDVCNDLDLNVDINFGKNPFHPYEPMHLVADITRARQIGWQPRTRLAYAVWQLAKSQFPSLNIREPRPTS